jgi:hypothetical protein
MKQFYVLVDAIILDGTNETITFALIVNAPDREEAEEIAQQYCQAWSTERLFSKLAFKKTYITLNKAKAKRMFKGLENKGNTITRIKDCELDKKYFDEHYFITDTIKL